MAKLRVGILFGGRSGEHEVSLLSAASVLEAIDKTKYEVVPIGITKDGHWLVAEHAERLLKGEKHAGGGAHATPTHLRAGDPEATPGAALLARGESVIVPPEPAHRKRNVSLSNRRESAARRGSRHQRGCHLPRTPRHIWRRWDDSRSARTGRHRLRWRRRAWLLRRYG